MTKDPDAPDRTAHMVRDHYNPPPDTPRDDIWAMLEARIRDEAPDRGTPRREPAEAEPSEGVFPIATGRRGGEGARRPWTGFRGFGWMAAAATVVMALGIGVGRWSRGPLPTSEDGVAAQGPRGSAPRRAAAATRIAAAEHLSRAEPLLTLVKGDVARGTVDPAVEGWARDLLGQTRFLLDSGLPLDPEMVGVLEDLEMVLVQATLVAGGEVEGDRARQELELLGEGMEDRNVLPRIQAILPATGAGLAGS